MYEPLGRGELHSAAFQIAWQIQNVLVLSSKKNYLLKIIIVRTMMCCMVERGSMQMVF